ncbi:MAG TPA: TIGR03435 family protein [Bryobacteraceae bacterium]|jgi:uncharacterized protein (TIGR03435 family)
MKTLLLCALAVAALPASGQNITGTWQGSLKPGERELRTVVKISLVDDKLAAVFYSIDQNPTPVPISSITQDGSTIKMSIAAMGGTYEGRLSQDGNTITGTWSQGNPLPLNLTRATPETAWTIPDPPPPPRQLKADVNPVFEVATIKPHDPNGRGFSLLVGPGGTMTTTSTTLSDLMVFAFGIHTKQIVNGPAWLETEKFDITAKPDQEGIPNEKQLRGEMQKLLAERFHLTFHHDTKELSVYAIMPGKGEPKLTKNDNGGSLPTFGMGPGRLTIRNGTMTDLAGLLQAQVLERPVVDQTGLKDKYDFIIRWTPDPSQFGGRAANAPPPPDNTEAPPDLFTAFQQQLGLKLESTKAPVDVLVLDKVEKPSEN